MKNGLIALGVFAAFLAILYAVSYLPAKWMVKKRILFAKRHLIGQETPENIELMKSVARAVLAYNTIYLELLENDEYTVNTTVHYGTISEVRVKNKLVEVFASNDGTEKVSHSALSEKGGVIVTAVDITCILFLIFGFCVLFSMV